MEIQLSNLYFIRHHPQPIMHNISVVELFRKKENHAQHNLQSNISSKKIIMNFIYIFYILQDNDIQGKESS